MSHGVNIRTDLERCVVGGFAFPLGIDAPHLTPPTQGYTIAYNPGDEEEPDTYTFHIVVTHERVGNLIHRVFELLPEMVYGIFEIGSRDAYRAVDVFVGEQPVSRETFLAAWEAYEPLLLEDGSIAAGANSDEPFIEVFIDQWKGVFVHVPLSQRDHVESMLAEMKLEEVPETWPVGSTEGDMTERDLNAVMIRAVLDPSDDMGPDMDEMLLDLRHSWMLQLDIDPTANVDDAGRELGLTLWHAVVLLRNDSEGQSSGATLSIWATADSLSQIDQFIDETLADFEQWSEAEVFSTDRVAYDERPDELADLPPRPTEATVLWVHLDNWVALAGDLETEEEN